MNSKEISKEEKQFLVILDVICCVQGKYQDNGNEYDASTMRYYYSTILQCSSSTLFNEINTWIDFIITNAIAKRIEDSPCEYSYKITKDDVYIHYEKISITEL